MDKKKKGATEWNSLSVHLRSEVKTELNAELTSLTKPSCHKFYQRAQVNKNLSSSKAPGIGILLSYLMFIVYS